MVTGGKTSQPIGHYEFCLTHREECAVKASGEERIQLTAERWNELVAVNNGVNTRIVPATDEELYGRPEFWTYPSGRGDCEDMVLLKRRILEGKGWPTGSLLITVVRQRNGDGHAVLTVLTDRGDLVLDNLEPHILVWSETGYQYVKRQSELDSGAWVAIDDGRATMEVGSLKN
jgi:predicted transglutaminase-like cysteine proteinase